MTRVVLVRAAIAVAAFGVAACSSPSGGAFDMGGDFAIGPAVTHVGANAPTCCMVTNGARQVLYLANPSPPTTNAQGRDLPASGELHLADPFGADVALASGVPAFGYAFSPDGRAALFLSKTPSGGYSLDIATLGAGPGLQLPPISVVVGDGLQNAALLQQAFFTPSGRYLVVGVLPKNVAVSADLHVIELASGRDVFALTNGAFDYQEQVTLDDTMIFANSTASTIPGVPSVEGLYMVSLPAAPSVPAALIDTHVTNFATTADGGEVVYARENGDLVMFGLRQRDVLPLASGVTAFSLGPSRRGPVVYTTGDGALHVRALIAPETVSTVAGAVDYFSPIAFSPDAGHLYWFQNVSTQNGTGDLWHAPLPPVGAATTGPAMAMARLVAMNASTRDLRFVADRMVYLTNVDAQGTTGDVTLAAVDGAGAQVVAHGAATGELVVALPAAPEAAATGGPQYGAIDMAPVVTPPLFVHLTNATANLGLRMIDGSRPVIGTLVMGGAGLLAGGGEETVLAEDVQTGRFVLSEDGYVIVFVGGAVFSRIAGGYVGSLGLAQTRSDVDVAPVVPKVDGVSEVGAIEERSLFVDAPGANPPGIYFVHY